MKVPRVVAVGAVTLSVLVLAGCGVGRDAVAQDGKFEFVSPGGKLEIFYDPPGARGVIGDLKGPALIGDRSVRVTDYPGKIMVINVWGSWCAPCRTETPGLQRLFAQVQPLGVQFLGVDVRDSRQEAQDFVIDQHVTYPSIFDPSMASLAALGGHYPTSVVPTTLVLDAAGLEAARASGAPTREQVLKAIDTLP